MTDLTPLLLLAALIGSLTWLRFMAARSLRTDPAKPPENPQDTERRLTTSLFAGKLDQAGYQQAMADLARGNGWVDTGIETGVLAEGKGDPRAQLAMLGVALPEVPPAVLCSAFVMAQNGADSAALIDQLHLNHWQANTIIASSRR